MRELKPRDHSRRDRHGLEAVYGGATSLRRPLVLLRDVAEITAGPDRGLTPEQRGTAQQPERPTFQNVPRKRYLPGFASMVRGHGLSEECLDSCNTVVRPQQEIDRATSSVDGPIEIAPIAPQLHVPFIDAARTDRRVPESAPRLSSSGT
jgi:hypothetical protein